MQERIFVIKTLYEMKYFKSYNIVLLTVSQTGCCCMWAFKQVWTEENHLVIAQAVVSSLQKSSQKATL